MIGEGYWSTGITVAYYESGNGKSGWTADVDFLDESHRADFPGTTIISTRGSLRTSNMVMNIPGIPSSLASVIDVIKADAERLGITWKSPAIYYKGDGVVEDINDLDAPEGWLQMLPEQAQRLGWASGRRYVEQGTERCTR